MNGEISFTIAKHLSHHKTTAFSPLLTGCLLTAFLAFQILMGIFASKSQVLGATLLEPSEIIALTNLKRQEAGLPTLTHNEQLTKAAEAKALDMFEFGYWDHFSPAKRPPWSFILDSGYDYHFAGENLAKDFDDPTKLIDAWMSSPSHRENILNQRYDDIGIAVVHGKLNDKETVLIVQMFGTLFKPSDFGITPENMNQLRENKAETPILEYRNSILDIVRENQFEITKILAFGIVLLLLFTLMKDIIDHIRIKQSKKLSKKHWGHLLFLIVLGSLIFATKNSPIF